jgi:pyruvate dehydrogenase E2 component (dihydrolipoamide acetyltransferase)
MAEFTMPSLGADMDSGTLLEWLVEPGQHVQRGDIVAVVDTAKSAIEVEVFDEGTVEELLVEEGTVVPVGTPLARISSPGSASGAEIMTADRDKRHPDEQGHPESPVEGEHGSGATPREHRPATGQPALPPVRHLAHTLGVDLEDVRGTGPGGAVTRQDVLGAVEAREHRGPPARHRASPLARRLAREHGVDLSVVSGTARLGAIRAADVMRAVEAAAAPPEATGADTGRAAPRAASAGEDRQLAMRQAIAVLMARSAREIPHYYLQTSIDFSTAQDWLRETNAARRPMDRVLPAALLLTAAARAAQDVPSMNGYWQDDRFQPSAEVNLGVAISLRGGGLVTPAIVDAGQLSVDEVMARLVDMVKRARRGRLRQTELTAGTITVTNLGDTGADLVHGVIYPPQVALLGFGRIRPRAWAVGDMLAVRPVVEATLAADHRASDGHTGGLLLKAVERYIARPEDL